MNKNILGRIIFEESFSYGKKEETYTKKVEGLEILLKYDHLSVMRADGISLQKYCGSICL